MKRRNYLPIICLFFICIAINTKLFGQTNNTITPQEFLQKFDSIQNLEYLVLLNSIQANDIEKVKRMISSNSFENLKTNFSFEINNIYLLKNTLESKWPNDSIKYFSDIENVVSYIRHNRTTKYKERTINRARNGNTEELKLTFESYVGADKSYINFKGSEIFCYHTNFLTIQISGNTAKIQITDPNTTFFIIDTLSPFKYSCKIHRNEICLLLLESGISLTSEYTKTIFDILREDSIQFFKKVYSHIENPQSMTYSGMNMLHYSIQLDKPEFFNFLIENGFKLTNPTNEGLYPIHIASENSNEITFRILKLMPSHIELTDSIGRGALHHAAASGNSNTTKEILLHNPNIDARDNNGATPLMLACANPTANFRGLLIHGADFSLTDYSNNNNINYAINHKNCNGVRYLLRYKKYNFETQSFSDLRKYSKNNNACTSILTLTRRFHTEFKFQLNSTMINYEGAKSRVSGGYGVEFSYRLFPWADLCYTFNRLYVESGISGTNELLSLQLSEDHFSSYETNYFEHITSLKLYPVHYLTKNTTYLRLGYNFRKVQEAGLLADMIIVDDLTNISIDPFKGISAGIGRLLRGRGRVSFELNYTHGLTDVNIIFPGSYNTLSFIIGAGF